MAAVVILALAIGQVQAESINVPGGDFQMYKPGTGYTVTAEFPGVPFENYASGIGDNLPVNGAGIADYSDGTTGGFIDMPGWAVVQGTNYLFSNGVGGSTGFNASGFSGGA